MRIYALVFIVLFPTISSATNTTSLNSYQSGQALKESQLMFSDVGKKDFGSATALFMKSVKDFDYIKYHIWTGNLIKHGKDIRNSQNKIQDQLFALGTGGISDESNAKVTLSMISSLHRGIYNYEKDVYDFINVASISGMNESSSMIDPLMLLLRDIKDNENNSYLLANSIINNVSADKISKESLEISRRSMKLSEDSVKLARGANILAVTSILFTAIISFIGYLRGKRRGAALEKGK